MTLLALRNEYKKTQEEIANLLGVPVRTYRRYETNESYGSEIKRNAFINIINSSYEVSEEKGILSLETIKQKVKSLFDAEYKGEIRFCCLFGSYARGTAKENSDVDLYVSSNLPGFRFVGLTESLRTILHKKVDVIRDSELENNIELVNDILKEGIKIYG